MWLKTMIGVDATGCERQALSAKHMAQTESALQTAATWD